MSITIYESKKSEKVLFFISAQQPSGWHDQLIQYCSTAYAKKIIAAQQNGQLWGLHLTKSGRIKATFI